MDKTISCNEARGLFPLHYFGELRPEDAALLDAHLGSCPLCRASMGELFATLDKVKPRLPGPRLSGEVVTGVLEKIGGPRRIFSGRLVRALAVSGAVAAAAALVITLGITRFQHPAQPAVPVVTAKADLEVLENYEVVNNLDVLENLDTLERMDKL